jgi:hypothetical protein
MLRAGIVTVLFATALTLPARTARPEVSIIHSTDLCHPHGDPDDHYDLACLFALKEFDIKGIVLDLGEEQAVRPGRPAVQQMMHITGRRVPYAVGLSKPLRSGGDQALDEAKQFQGGVELILAVLRRAGDKVVLHTGGSCRDVAAAFNRQPELFRSKVKAIYIDAGNGPEGEQNECNVKFSPAAYLRLLESGLPVYWCPCFGRDGYQTFYVAQQPTVLAGCTAAVQNYFVYCLTKSKAEPIAFLASGAYPLPSGERQMWCTGGLLHAACRKIYQRDKDDFVALSPQEAEKAGLADKAIEVYRFVPARFTVERPSVPKKVDRQPQWPRLRTELNPPQANCFVFRVIDPRYGNVMASCLKNLLSELGR